MRMDLVISGGTVVTASDVFRADVGISGQQVVAIGQGLAGQETIDASGMFVLPGAIDPHVHLQYPQGPVPHVSSDNWASGTRAAACGGTTAVIDFVEAGPGQTLVEAFRRRREQADPQVVVDYGLHVTLNRADRETLAELEEVMAAGATSFKLYMAYDNLRLDDGQFLAALEALRVHNGLPIVHAENHFAIKHLARRELAAGHTAPRYFPRTRPDVMEGEATARALALAELVGLPVYIVHVSCARALRAVAQAQERGQPAYGETCPHYLLLADDLYDRDGFEPAKYVMSPPLRKVADQEALWRGLARTVLQVVATDHCPFFFRGQKDRDPDDFTKIPGGAAGVETRLPLLYTYGVRRGRLTLSRWVDVCCTAPARLFGLYPQKGTLAPGSDADVVVFDPDLEVTLSHRTLHQNVDYTPYEGFELRGYPLHVLSRGEVVVRDGAFVGEKGRGRFLRRRPFDLQPAAE
jgi:dihydropyrimidinase